MSRFFVPKENVAGSRITIEGQEARHILNVMRMTIGDHVVVFDGTGVEYEGVIKEIKGKTLAVDVVSVKAAPKEALPYITLVQAMPKKDKMDTIVEKATELGVKEIVPIVSARTIVDIEDEVAKHRVSRWSALALAASKQCHRTDVPKVAFITRFCEALNYAAEYDLCIFACLSDEVTALQEVMKGFKKGRIIVFIGPEGDFTPDEIAAARKLKNLRLVSLGARVLKSDTAALYVLSCLNYELT